MLNVNNYRNRNQVKYEYDSSINEYMQNFQFDFQLVFVFVRFFNFVSQSNLVS